MWTKIQKFLSNLLKSWKEKITDSIYWFQSIDFRSFIDLTFIVPTVGFTTLLARCFTQVRTFATKLQFQLKQLATFVSTYFLSIIVILQKSFALFYSLSNVQINNFLTFWCWCNLNIKEFIFLLLGNQFVIFFSLLLNMTFFVAALVNHIIVNYY